jgi:uncharacterized protein (TIGR02996 family)
MTPHAPFLHAICARPEDDGPRLLFADFLRENGEWDRAEFIEVQCELARMEKRHHHECTGTITRDVESAQLRRREREIRLSYLWIEDLPGTYCGGGRNMIIKHDDTGRGIDYHFRRGFVEECTMQWEQWQRHADAIRAATPIRKVRLTDWPRTARLLPVEGKGGAYSIPEYRGIEFELPQRMVEVTTFRDGAARRFMSV